MRGLTAATRHLIRDALDATPFGARSLEFVEAVVVQVAHPLGSASRDGAAGHESMVTDRVLRLLRSAVGDDASVTAAANDLATEPPLLAAFFQNLDLLPPAGFPPADAVGLLVMLALSRLEETGTAE
jgi:hypothetical protein